MTEGTACRLSPLLGFLESFQFGEYRHYIKDQDCPLSFWGEAASTTAYCLNHTPTSANGGITPHEAFFGTVPDVSHLCTFYSDAYIHQPKSHGAKKLGDCAILVKFVGYPEGVSGYKFWDPTTCTMKLSQSAHFLDDKSPSKPPPSPAPSIAELSNPSPSPEESVSSAPPHDNNMPLRHASDPTPPPPSPSPPATPTPPLPSHCMLQDCSQL